MAPQEASSGQILYLSLMEANSFVQLSDLVLFALFQRAQLLLVSFLLSQPVLAEQVGQTAHEAVHLWDALFALDGEIEGALFQDY